MKLRTIVIDDEPIALEKLKSYATKVPFLELAGAYSSGLEAMARLSEGDIDLIFTDIEMPDLNGLEMCSALPHPPMTVFITAYAQYAVDSYRLSAVDYLLKPYSFADFQRASNKALERQSIHKSDPESATPLKPAKADGEEPLFVKVDYRYVRIELQRIRYIKGYGEYLQIYLEGEEKPLLTLSSFSGISNRLSDSFLQVHRSYIVNMRHVDHIIRQRIVMDEDTYIPVGDSYRNALQEYLQGHTPGGQGKRQ